MDFKQVESYVEEIEKRKKKAGVPLAAGSSRHFKLCAWTLTHSSASMQQAAGAQAGARPHTQSAGRLSYYPYSYKVQTKCY